MTRPVLPVRRGWLLTGLVAAGTSVMLAAAPAQQQPPPAGRTGGGGNNFANNFTGKIAVQDSSNMRMSRIRFEAGARTNWHVHSTGQLLLVEEGRGRLFEQGGTIVDLPAGQPFYTKPNVPHWHGAAPDSPALQFSVYSGTLEWQAPVTDAEYAGKTGR